MLRSKYTNFSIFRSSVRTYSPTVLGPTVDHYALFIISRGNFRTYMVHHYVAIFSIFRSIIMEALPKEISIRQFLLLGLQLIPVN